MVVILLFLLYSITTQKPGQPQQISYNKKNSDKWIVVTSINQPTDQVKHLANSLHGFKLIVVGDLKTNLNWSLNNTVYMNIQEQKQLGFNIFKSVPFNSYTRKNLGYLFAIKHGAKFIYDTDDDNAPTLDLNSHFNFKEQDLGLVYDFRVETAVPNVYAHFGQPTIWPRGYPLTHISANFNNSYFAGVRKRSAIQQGVVNGDPDVDAIFRLTKSMQYKRINLFFDQSAPSLQLPINKLSPFNSQNTLFAYEAFWAMYLPSTVSFRLTDIWRSYWAQRLMWLTNQTVSFHGPSAYQMRSPHSYLKDFDEEKSMYSQTENLVKFLLGWKCEFTKFYSCVLDLSSQMAREGFWKIEEVKAIKLWLHDLNSIGYKEPKLVNFELNDQKNQYLGHSIVRFTPNFQTSIDQQNLGEAYYEQRLVQKSIGYFHNLCSGFNATLNSNLINLKPKKFNFTLLITFNHLPIEENIVILKHLYQNVFQNLVFCGLRMTEFLSKDHGVYKLFDSYTFIPLDTIRGDYHYECMTKAIELNYDNSAGIFLMSDDVLLKTWKLKQFDAKKIWYLQKLVLDSPINETAKMWWQHWARSVKSMKKVWEYFDLILKASSKANSTESLTIKKYIKQLNANKNSPSEFPKITIAGSDWFYLPRDKFESFHLLSKIYRRYDVFLETAVPNLLAGLDSNNFTEVVMSGYRWGMKPFDFRTDYNDTFVLNHPFKLSWLKTMRKGEDFCRFYITELLRKWQL
jgi:hypothetical protein